MVSRVSHGGVWFRCRHSEPIYGNAANAMATHLVQTMLANANLNFRHMYIAQHCWKMSASASKLPPWPALVSLATSTTSIMVPMVHRDHINLHNHTLIPANSTLLWMVANDVKVGIFHVSPRFCSAESEINIVNLYCR